MTEASSAGATATATATAHQFYGTVNYNGKPVGPGYTVTATINGQQVASTVTDAQGNWGYSPTFIITAPCTSAIEFYVNGILAGTASGCISTNRLDLVYNGTITKLSSTAAAATSPIITVSSGGTVTFFIGQQPENSSSTSTANIEKPLVVYAPPVASIAITDLYASPQAAISGNEVIIAVKLLNRGNIKFTGGIILRINDMEEEQKGVDLPEGQSCTLLFTVTRPVPGVYRASIDDYSTDFIVTAANQVESPVQAEEDSNTEITKTAEEVQHVAQEETEAQGQFESVLVIAGIVTGVILAIILVVLMIRNPSRY